VNNYNQSIFCDENTELTSEIKYTGIEVKHPNTFVTTTDKDIKIVNTRYLNDFAYYNNDIIIGKSLEYYGEYTELEIQLLRNFIKNNYVIYDVGANIGYHTVAFASLGKHVYAFEPNKKNHKLLCRNVKKFNNVTVYDTACSNKNGTMFVEDFNTDVPGNYGEMHMLEDGQECKSQRIDDIDDIYGPDLLKIDVEGHELQVLLGSLETIKEFKPIIFYEAHGSDLDEIYTLLSDLGYKLYWFPCNNYNPNNFSKRELNVFGNGGVLNILAVHNMPRIGNLLQVKLGQTFSECITEYLNTKNDIQK
jgi:FkbM family methyltransferase